MDKPISKSDADPRPACARCRTPLREGRSYVFKVKRPPERPGGAAQEADSARCLRCALRHGPLLRRSLYAALVVGTALTALNQGDVLLSGQWANAFYWKIPLTYCVPFIVSTYGALSNIRR